MSENSMNRERERERVKKEDNDKNEMKRDVRFHFSSVQFFRVLVLFVCACIYVFVCTVSLHCFLLLTMKPKQTNDWKIV